jgi:hypothetical protein
MTELDHAEVVQHSGERKKADIALTGLGQFHFDINTDKEAGITLIFGKAVEGSVDTPSYRKIAISMHPGDAATLARCIAADLGFELFQFPDE